MYLIADSEKPVKTAGIFTPTACQRDAREGEILPSHPLVSIGDPDAVSAFGLGLVERGVGGAQEAVV